MSDPLAPPPRCIYLIRHGEKPVDGDGTAGVDDGGTPNPHSLTPRGWQRSGALAVRFVFPAKSDAVALSVPDQLFAPGYGNGATTQEHRPFQTLLALSTLIDPTIESPYAVGEEAQLADAVLALPVDTVLICWEHQNIPAILAAIGNSEPITSGSTTAVPTEWPGERFDLIWRLSHTGSGYEFTPIPQAVLAGDENAGIPT